MVCPEESAWLQKAREVQRGDRGEGDLHSPEPVHQSAQSQQTRQS